MRNEKYEVSKKIVVFRKVGISRGSYFCELAKLDTRYTLLIAISFHPLIILLNQLTKEYYDK
jgi:hypothetical protein